jgi:hemoglobin-like flavoprotein
MKLSTHPLAEPLPRGVAAPADERLILRLRVSLAGLLAKGDALSAAFYDDLFGRHPALRPLFPADMAAQRVKLTEMLAWIVSALDRPDKTLPAITDMGRRHVGYGAKPEHYPLVRDSLIVAMGKVAGPGGWDEELAEDWRQTINLIARHMLTGAAGPAPTAPVRPPAAR